MEGQRRMLTSDVIAFIIISLGFILMMCAVFSPYWKATDSADTLNDQIFQHEGLWLNCRSHSYGNWECDDFNRFFLGLDALLQGARGLGLGSMFFCLISLTSMIIGCECNRCNSRLKKHARLVAGITAMISGICLVIAASLYAKDTTVNWFNATDQYGRLKSGYRRMVFGWCIFVGWVGGAVLLIGGVVATILGCRDREEQGSYPAYSYRPDQEQVHAYPPQPYRNYAYQPEKAAPITQEYV